MRLAWLGLIAAMFVGAASACEIDSIRVEHNSGDGVTVCENGRFDWQQWYRYAARCGAYGDTLTQRRYLMRCDGEQSDADSIMDIAATQMGEDVLRSYRLQVTDWENKINDATRAIAVDDIRPSISALVDTLKVMGDPTVGQMANAWRTIAGRLTWIQTSEQADSLLYRIADGYEMSGVGLLNYMKANLAGLE